MVLPNNLFAGFCSNQLEYPSLITEKSGNIPFYINGYEQDDGNSFAQTALVIASRSQ